MSYTFTAAILVISLSAPAFGAKPPATPSLKPSIDAEDLVAMQTALDAGAVVSEKWSGASALYWASCDGSTDMIHLLVSKGAVVDETGILGITPLGCIANHPKDPGEMVEANAAMNARVLKHYTEAEAREHLWWRQTDPSKLSTAADRAKTLIELGADPNYVLGNGTVKELTPFLTAVQGGRLDLVKAMLDSQKVDPELRFHQWAEGVVAFAKYVDVGMYTKEGKAVARDWSQVPQFDTPLLFAIDKQNVDLVKLLVEGGANVNNGRKKERSDSTSHEFWLESPLDAALKTGNAEIIAYLQSKNAIQSE